MGPNDNPGRGALVVDCHFELKEPEGVLSVCRQYKPDGRRNWFMEGLWRCSNWERGKKPEERWTGPPVPALSLPSF